MCSLAGIERMRRLVLSSSGLPTSATARSRTTGQVGPALDDLLSSRAAAEAANLAADKRLLFRMDAIRVRCTAHVVLCMLRCAVLCIVNVSGGEPHRRC